MRFTAYVTRRDSPQAGLRSRYDQSIARIAQIFASDLMTEHCHQYALRCAWSGLPQDLLHASSYTPLQNSRIPALLPEPRPATSQFTFQGLPAGVLESYIFSINRTITTSREPEILTSTADHPMTSEISPLPSIRITPSHRRTLRAFQPEVGRDDALRKSSSRRGLVKKREDASTSTEVEDVFKAMTLIRSPLLFRNRTSTPEP